MAKAPGRFLVAVSLVALLLSVFGSLPRVFAAPDLYAPVIPDQRSRVLAETQGKLSTYTLDVQFDPQGSTIGGQEQLTWVNRFDRPLKDVAFRLYPNASYYGEGGTTVDDVRVAGAAASGSLEVAKTVLRVPLGEAVAPGGSVTLSFRFRTVIPANSSGTFGIFNHDTVHDAWVLADWYPIVAGYEAGTGWRLDAPTPAGDPTFSDAALYDVSVTAPAGFTLVATGSESETAAVAGGTQTRFESGPAREFTLVADKDYRATSTTVDGTKITAYVIPGTGAEKGAKLALETAAKALHSYSARYGRYPYQQLNLVETDLSSSVLAVSWSELIFLDGPNLLASSLFTDADPSLLDFTIAHEVGHQWWGAMIGANSNDHTFMIEGLTNALATVYVEDTQGKAAARRQIEIQLADRYLSALDTVGDGVVDLPVTAPRAGPSNGVLQYGKAALGFLAIRQTIGDDAFFAALADYATRFSFRNATPDDLLAAFERATGMDLSDVWKLWFEKAVTTRSDVEALLAAL